MGRRVDRDAAGFFSPSCSPSAFLSVGSLFLFFIQVGWSDGCEKGNRGMGEPTWWQSQQNGDVDRYLFRDSVSQPSKTARRLQIHVQVSVVMMRVG